LVAETCKKIKGFAGALANGNFERDSNQKKSCFT